jgi:hypothetical protein
LTPRLQNTARNRADLAQERWTCGLKAQTSAKAALRLGDGEIDGQDIILRGKYTFSRRDFRMAETI